MLVVISGTDPVMSTAISAGKGARVVSWVNNLGDNVVGAGSLGGSQDLLLVVLSATWCKVGTDCRCLQFCLFRKPDPSIFIM